MKSRLIFFVFISIALVLSACASVSQQDLQGTVQIAIALTALAQTAAAPTATVAAPEATLAPTTEPPVPVATEATGPEVVYLDVFGDAQAQIQGRVVEPFTLYYRTAGYPRIVSIAIQTVPDIPEYPYKAEAILEGGGTVGWLIHVTGSLVDWWLPECMGPCPFSDEFRTAYPDIVATMEP